MGHCVGIEILLFVRTGQNKTLKVSGKETTRSD